MIYRIVLAFTFLALIACSKNNEDPLTFNKVDPRVIYGNDDRVDLYDVTDPEWFDVAQSTVSIFDQKKLVDEGTHFKISSTVFGTTYGLCQDEPFFSQPISAFCSGSLIGPDLIVTAGHCIRNEYNCEKARFVFGYSYTTQNTDPTVIDKSDVYSCKEIIHSETNAVTGSDFALIRLDRKVLNHPVLPIQSDQLIADDQSLVVIGHPSGLPVKLAGNGKIRDNSQESFFVTNLDTYGGNSGSPVFNSSTKEIEGILVRGESDFIYDIDKQCRRSNKCDNDSCRGEDVVRISSILEHISASDLDPLPLRLPATLLIPPIVY